jgi:hypothetical protein
MPVGTQRQVPALYTQPAAPPVPTVQVPPGVGSAVGQEGAGVSQTQRSMPPNPVQRHVVAPKSQTRPSFVHAVMAGGTVAGHIPHDHVEPPPPNPAAQVQVTPP